MWLVRRPIQVTSKQLWYGLEPRSTFVFFNAGINWIKLNWTILLVDQNLFSFFKFRLRIYGTFLGYSEHLNSEHCHHFLSPSYMRDLHILYFFKSKIAVLLIARCICPHFECIIYVRCLPPPLLAGDSPACSRPVQSHHYTPWHSSCSDKSPTLLFCIKLM